MLLFSGYADTYDVTSDFGHRQDWTYCIWELLAFNGTESREESVGKSHILVFLGIHWHIFDCNLESIVDTSSQQSF